MMDHTLASVPTVLFFGSFLEYSQRILEKLLASDQLKVIGVVTTPPSPAGRDQSLKKTHVQLCAEKHHLPIFTPEKLDDASLKELSSLGQPDLILTAGYGKLLPESWLSYPRLGALNLHFSLLPKYRGANPAEWAILRGESETGVTLIKMSPAFDTGHILAQAVVSLTNQDTRDTTYEKLYALGGEVLPAMIQHFVQHPDQISPQPPSPTPYAKRFSRDDGFIAWSTLHLAVQGKAGNLADFSPLLQEVLTSLHPENTSLSANEYNQFIERAVRALSGFPSVWTIIPTSKGPKRMKLHRVHLEHGALVLDEVQVEGLQKTPWNQIKNILKKI